MAAFAPGGHMIAVASEDQIQIYSALYGLLNGSIGRISSTDYIPRLAAFTEDESGIVVVLSPLFWCPESSYQIWKFNLVEGSGQMYLTAPREGYPLRLSEYGSYIAFAEHKNKDTQICIWKTDGTDDVSIPFGKLVVRDLDLAGESVHLVAVAAKDITILSIPSGAIQRTLYHEGAEHVCMSRDGSFLASQTDQSEARLWSITQGTLLATFEADWGSLVFSRTNRLYMMTRSGGGRVYDVSADPNKVTIKSFPLPSHTRSILPDEPQILIRTSNDIQVWSLRELTDARDALRDDIIDIDLSRDASLLALATKTDIEILDARIGQRCKVIQCQNRNSFGPVAFSPKGELIVSLSDDGIIVVDVRAGVLLPTTYSFSPSQGRDQTDVYVINVGISFDSSKIAAIVWWDDQLSGKEIQYICVWDLPSGTLLHSLECNGVGEIQWSWTDQYLLFKPSGGDPRYLDSETFQEEDLEHSGDRFQGPNPSHLYYDEEKRRIRLSSATEGSLFSALPSHLDVRYFSSRGDRVCIISKDRRLLLLDTSGLAAYMEICNLQFQPEVSRMKVCWFFVIEILINPMAANVSDDMAYGRRFSCLVVCIP